MPQPRKNPPPKDASKDLDQVGARIKRFRVKRGFSQAELAEKVGLSREAIAAYESGRVHLLDDMIARLAVALTASADELLGLKPAPQGEASSGLRLTRRLRELDQLPEPKRKAILKTLDDLIRANS
jgi:transcriptional regulator with XRE-family HTH domain